MAGSTHTADAHVPVMHALLTALSMASADEVFRALVPKPAAAVSCVSCSDEATPYMKSQSPPLPCPDCESSPVLLEPRTTTKPPLPH